MYTYLDCVFVDGGKSNYIAVHSNINETLVAAVMQNDRFPYSVFNPRPIL